VDPAVSHWVVERRATIFLFSRWPPVGGVFCVNHISAPVWLRGTAQSDILRQRSTDKLEFVRGILRRIIIFKIASNRCCTGICWDFDRN
jgi:hypothetical protein